MKQVFPKSFGGFGIFVYLCRLSEKNSKGLDKEEYL